MIPVERIERSILLIRGQKVILDRNLADLYGVETRVLNQAVRRNRDRFPDDFLLELTREEIRNISQIVTCSTIKHAKNVYAFTEHGVAMLSSVLRSPRAVRVNIEIIRAFVRLRQLLKSHADLAWKLAEMEKDMMINSVWFSRRFGNSWFLRMNRRKNGSDLMSENRARSIVQRN